MHHFCIFMLLMTQLALTSVGQVRVLCVGSDGHVSIEQAHDLCKQSASTSHDDHASGNSCQSTPESNQLCLTSEPCKDVPLPGQQIQLVGRDHLDQLAAQAPMALPWTGQLLPIALPASVFNHFAFASNSSISRQQTYLSLASTILLI